MAGRVAALGRAGIRVAGQAGVVVARVARPALATLANVANRGLNSILARADMILPAIFFGTMIDWDNLWGMDLVEAMQASINLLYDYDNDALYYEDFDTGVPTYYDDDIEEINQQIKDALEYAGYDLEADFGLAGSSPSAMAMRNKKFDKIAKKYPKPREMSNDMYSVYISAINYNLYKKSKKARSKKPMPKPMPKPIVSKGMGRTTDDLEMLREASQKPITERGRRVKYATPEQIEQSNYHIDNALAELEQLKKSAFSKLFVAPARRREIFQEVYDRLNELRPNSGINVAKSAIEYRRRQGPTRSSRRGPNYGLLNAGLTMFNPLNMLR